ncbi:hypothetical protein KY092_18285 [Natronomonas gomsonensis]|jgi:hypothetical protein|uniref:DUF7115 domain-containing protein n=1 Tax=Natronomonas gomsonensis TaxID=1046043 RepID=UPI0020CA446E|nr:hypothetical protein [Natronomonas gomsonensis]MCY4732493.1 hypothetical protein [Natronomonas gomsonensis]
MDELPALVTEAVGDATVIEIVDVGGGDAVVVTPEATHVYRSEGLLSDESLDSYDHDVERFAVDTGRRKSTIRLDGIDGERSFTVPGSVADSVIEAVLEGVLGATGVVAEDEAVDATFRFSELTLVVTDRQLLKHVGSAVWDEEFEAFRYENLADLDFEEGSVATQVVVEADGRKQRVKVPNEHAGRVREDVQSAVFEFHGVSSLGGLRAAIEDGSNDETAPGEAADADDNGTTDDSEVADDGFVSSDWSPPADQDVTGRQGMNSAESTDDEGPTGDVRETAEVDIEELAEEVEALRETVEYQTELLEAQGETIEQLVDELRRGR